MVHISISGLSKVKNRLRLCALAAQEIQEPGVKVVVITTDLDESDMYQTIKSYLPKDKAMEMDGVTVLQPTIVSCDWIKHLAAATKGMRNLAVFCDGMPPEPTAVFEAIQAHGGLNLLCIAHTHAPGALSMGNPYATN